MTTNSASPINDAYRAATAAGMHPNEIAAALTEPGARLVLTMTPSTSSRSTSASSDLPAECDFHVLTADLHAVQPIHVAVKLPDGTVRMLKQLDMDAVKSFIVGHAQDRLTRRLELGHIAVLVLNAFKSRSIVIERLLEADRCTKEANAAERRRANAVEKATAALASAVTGNPMPGDVTVADLATASDEDFLRMVVSASSLYGSGTSVRARLFRLLGKDPGFDAAYEQFWTHSSMRRDFLEDATLWRGRNFDHVGDDVTLAVEFYTDPVACVLKRGGQLNLSYVLEAGSLLREHLEVLSQNLPAGWESSDEDAVRAAGALNMLRTGADLEATAGVLGRLPTNWRTPFLTTTTTENTLRARAVEAFLVLSRMQQERSEQV